MTDQPRSPLELVGQRRVAAQATNADNSATAHLTDTDVPWLAPAFGPSATLPFATAPAAPEDVPARADAEREYEFITMLQAKTKLGTPMQLALFYDKRTADLTAKRVDTMLETFVSAEVMAGR